MIGVTGISPLISDMELVTDGSTTVFNFAMNGFSDGAIILLAVSLVNSSTSHCSYLLSIHKQNNIGASVTTLSSKVFNGLAMTFSATYTTLTITLNTPIVGNLKIAPLLMNL